MRLLISVLTAASLAAGCATDMTRTVETNRKDVQRQAQDGIDTIQRTIEEGKPENATVKRLDEAWLGANPVEISRGKLPEFLSVKVSIAQEVGSLSEMGEYLSAIAKVPVRVSEEASSVAVRNLSGGGSFAQSSATQAAPRATPALPPLPVPGTAPRAAQGAASNVTINFSGPLSSLLDLVASRFGVFWRYVPTGAIEFFYRETKTWTVYAMPGTSKIETNIGTSSDSGGSGTSTGTGSSTGSSSSSEREVTQTTKSTVELKAWDNMEGAIKAMLSRDGQVVVTSSIGTVTVTDIPPVLDQVHAYIKSQNATMGRQVLLDVKVVTVTLFDDEQFGIDWSLVYRNLGASFGLSNVFPVSTAASALSVNILNGRGRTSQAVINALAQQGRVGQVTSASAFTLNNQAVPIQVGSQNGFIARSETTVTANVGVTATFTPGNVTSGFAMQLLPHILDEQNLLLQFAVDISDKPRFRSVSQSGTTIELFDQDTRNFMQRVSLQSGETLVISGFEQTVNSLNRQGVITPDNPALGGGRAARQDRQIVVIMITPVVMDRSRI